METKLQDDKRFYIREIHGGKYCFLNAANNLIIANDIADADTFTFEEVQHHLSGKKKRFYEAVPVPTADLGTEADNEPSSVKAADDAMLLKQNWNGIVSQLSYLNHHASEYEAMLEEQLKSVQEEICDIQHYLELYAETPEEAQKAAQLLQDSLHRRRKIKDAMIVLGVLRSDLLNQDLDSRISSCMAQIEAMDNRRYRPRQLPELFIDQQIAS